MPPAPPPPAPVDQKVLDYLVGEFAPSGSITFMVDDDALTFAVVDGDIVVAEGHGGGDTVVRLSQPAWDDVIAQFRTFISLLLADDLTFDRGGAEQLVEWDPLLKYLYAGIPPYDPSRADLGGRDPLATFTLADSDDELASQLQTMGYLHLTGVFSEAEMKQLDAEIDRLAAQAEPEDDHSWWATDGDGQRVLCRLVYISMRSVMLAGIEADPRIQRLGRLLNPLARPAPDRMEGTMVLLKAPGQTSGLSNIPWHQDCGLGGHAIMCPTVLVGIQITGSNAATGNLRVIPGSHGQALPYFRPDQLDRLPVVEVDTAPGDVTVHVQDVMHASPAPMADGGRRTMYVTFYPEKLWKHIGPGQAYNDLLRNRTEEVGRLAGQ